MEILPLFTHKHVKVDKNTNSYIIRCLQNDIRPGVYAIVNVQSNTWYCVETICTKHGIGRPGIWIGTPTKKTLYFGEKVMDSRKTYIRKSFFTSKHTKLLIGILVENCNNTSSFILEKFIVHKKQVEDEDYYKKEDEIQNEKNMDELHDVYNTYNPVDMDNTVLDVNYTEEEFDNMEEFETFTYPIYTIQKKYKLLTVQQNIYSDGVLFPIQLGISLENTKTTEDSNIKIIPYLEDTKQLEYIQELEKGHYIQNIPEDIFPFVYKELETIDTTKKTQYVIKDKKTQYVIKDKKTQYMLKDIFSYSKEFLHTVALVQYMESIIQQNGKEILFLINKNSLSDIHISVLHGYKLYKGGKNCVDYPKNTNIYSHPYYHIEDEHVNRSRIPKRIELHHFSYIIIMGYPEEYPFQERIEKYYYHNEILFVDNTNTNTNTNTNRKGVYFSNKI